MLTFAQLAALYPTKVGNRPQKDCEDIFKIVSYNFYRAGVRKKNSRPSASISNYGNMYNEEIEGGNESCSNSLSDSDEPQNHETLDEVYRDYLSQKHISSHRQGFVSIMITGVSILIRGISFLFVCFMLFHLGQRFVEWFMNQGLEYLKYGRRLNSWERFGYWIGQWSIWRIMKPLQ